MPFPNKGIDDGLESPYEVIREMLDLNNEANEGNELDNLELKLQLSKLARLVVEEFYKNDITLREYGDFAEFESLEYGVDFLWEEGAEFDALVQLINELNGEINETMSSIGQERLPHTSAFSRVRIPSEEDIDEDYNEDEVFNVKDMFPYPYSPRSSYDPRIEIYSLSPGDRVRSVSYTHLTLPTKA